MDFTIKPFRQHLRSAQGKRLALLAASFLVLGVVLFYLGKAPSPIKLDRHNPLDMVSLKQSWAQGEVIVLVRHLERCDHSGSPCLKGTTGITRRAVDVASRLGNAFRQLGLANADVFNSPTERTVQSANFIFGTDSSTQDWLATCKQSMDKDVFAHKRAHRNLILVTHSECIAEFEKVMHLKPITLDYGASLFIVDDRTTINPQVLGYIDSDDWQEAMGK